VDLAEIYGFKVKEIRMIVTSAELVVVPPLVIIELIWIRLLMKEHLDLKN